MANFVLKEVKAVGTPSIFEDGSLTQTCMVVTEIQGIKSQGKILNDIHVFEVDNSIMANQAEPLNVAWSHIKDVLAPQFVLDNYSDLD